MKTYWWSGGIVPHLLDLGTRWKWVVSFTSQPLYPQRKSPGTHWIGGWVGPRAVLDMVVKRKIPSPHWEWNRRTLIVQPVAQRCTEKFNELILQEMSNYWVNHNTVWCHCRFIVFLWLITIVFSKNSAQVGFKKYILWNDTKKHLKCKVCLGLWNLRCVVGNFKIMTKLKQVQKWLSSWKKPSVHLSGSFWSAWTSEFWTRVTVLEKDGVFLYIQWIVLNFVPLLIEWPLLVPFVWQ
jgi:hypothetical protein